MGNCPLTCYWARVAVVAPAFPSSTVLHNSDFLLGGEACTSRSPALGVHWTQFFKFRPEPDLAGTGKKFWSEVPAGTDLLSHI
jgi:hypothetical protein